MDDSIGRQAAIDKFEPWLKVKGYSEGELNMLKAVLYELRLLPPAQSEIIRCKDCKFTDGEKPIEDGRYWCILHDSFMYYCSDAERRTDDA